jgi:hypothetical protein
MGEARVGKERGEHVLPAALKPLGERVTRQPERLVHEHAVQVERELRAVGHAAGVSARSMLTTIVVG